MDIGGDGVDVARVGQTQVLHGRLHRPAGHRVVGGDTGTQVLGQVVARPRQGRRRVDVQRRHVPALGLAAVQVAAEVRAAQLGPRCVASGAMRQRLRQVVAAVPLGAALRIRTPGFALQIKDVPERHQRPETEGESHAVVRGRCIERGTGHEPGIHGPDVVLGQVRVMVVGEGRIQQMAVARYAFAQRAGECRFAPAADTGAGVGRDVGAVHGAEWRVQRASARVGTARIDGVAGGAGAHRRHAPAAFDGGLVECRHPRLRVDGGPPHDGPGRQCQQHQQHQHGQQQPAAAASRLARALASVHASSVEWQGL
jgi:hypothetical protein